MLAQKDQSFAHFPQEASHSGFRRFKFVTEFDNSRHHMPPLAHRKVARERNDVRAYVDEQHSTESNVFIDKSNNRSGNQPAALDSRQKKRIRLYELALGCQFLN